ncbi:MAG: hypothetical protein U0441_07850 [Polyangiaceae bacterium]
MKRSPNREVALTPERRALVESVRGIIVDRAKHAAARYKAARFEDLVAFGEDGAIAAAQDYRDGEGATFATFAWSRIWGAMENGMARERRAASVPATLASGIAEGTRQALLFAEDQRDTADPFHDTEEDDARRPAEALDGFAMAFLIGFSMGQPAGTPEAAARDAETHASVASLKGRDELIVKAYVFEKKSFAEIAAELPGDVRPATVQRHYHAAIGRLAKRVHDPKG